MLRSAFPARLLKFAVIAIFAAAIMTAIGACGVAAAQTMHSGGHTNGIQFGLYLGLAGLLALLGIQVQRHSRIALWLAIIFYLFDSVVTVFAAVEASRFVWFAHDISSLQTAFVNVSAQLLSISVVIHIIALILMCLGFLGFDALDKGEH